MTSISSISTILLIDDDPAMFGFLSIFLSDKESVIGAADGEEGILLARTAKPNLILLGVSMDGIDGFEVCRRPKASPATSAIPIRFVAAVDDEELEVQAWQPGAADFITKPFRPAKVRARAGKVRR